MSRRAVWILELKLLKKRGWRPFASAGVMETRRSASADARFENLCGAEVGDQYRARKYVPAEEVTEQVAAAKRAKREVLAELNRLVKKSDIKLMGTVPVAGWGKVYQEAVTKLEKKYQEKK